MGNGWCMTDGWCIDGGWVDIWMNDGWMDNGCTMDRQWMDGHWWCLDRQWMDGWQVMKEWVAHRWWMDRWWIVGSTMDSKWVSGELVHVWMRDGWMESDWLNTHEALRNKVWLLEVHSIGPVTSTKAFRIWIIWSSEGAQCLPPRSHCKLDHT